MGTAAVLFGAVVVPLMIARTYGRRRTYGRCEANVSHVNGGATKRLRRTRSRTQRFGISRIWRVVKRNVEEEDESGVPVKVAWPERAVILSVRR